MNPFDVIKNAKEIQEKISSMKNTLDNEIVEGVSGGGLVKVRLTGSFEMDSVELEPMAVDNRDIPMLQDLIKAAHNNAVDKLRELIQSKFGPLAAGVPLQ